MEAHYPRQNMPMREKEQLSAVSDVVDLGKIESMLADRDARIAELERVVAELSNSPASSFTTVDEAETRRTIAAIEARLDEQEHSLRHVLTMLIEWFEDDSREAA